ncbi:flavin-containing monooxygenase [Marinobacter arenosus]|uniref:flavin-containing monooxygenase n=1 Tax=Marinobacter arenosus TaxID=2856822 RepID=UPI001C4DCAA9|nr:NAD(P)/FAD-dependent oxidoreductase [Marinobacter arenosus]MBW0147977.1 NAD(P)/FAD-dependent oxidoreductase [Marinobacter arenosus]
MSQTTKIAIIGTGFSGLGMGIKLKEAGYNDFVILEQSDDVGGTWHENHYPGCACDVQSALYSFSFEQNPNWSRMFARQQEIKEYLRGCAEKYGLMEHIRLNTHVAGAHWDDQRAQWTVETCDSPTLWAYMQDKGLKPGDTLDRSDKALPSFERFRADIVVSAMGGLSTPAYPAIKGIETFTGKSFHSQDWDHGYDLRGKRVAVIGTGASAIQFVPEVAKEAARLDLYQRTPPWIMPKPDREIRPLEKALFRRFPQTLNALRQSIYWMLEARVLGFVGNPRILKLGELQARRHIRSQIKDKALRRKVTPDFHFGCKRVLISNNYYPALAQDHVNVLTDGIREVRGNVIVDGQGNEREVDCIIYGTGFKAQDPIPAGMVHGRNGQDLLEAWKEGAEAYKGSAITGFPNFFMLTGPNTGLGHSSMVYMIESQIQYILDAVKTMDRKGWRSVEVKEEAFSQYNASVHAKLGDSVWHTGCKSWYVNENGKNTTLWPGFTWQFRQQTRRFDAAQYRCEQVQSELEGQDVALA